jgi:signal transduction histidine kinase
MVKVIDDGKGIPPEVLSRIFDPFFTTKEIGQGTGLGLDIARRIVHRHRGALDVHSGPGRTEFCVTLPISK